jgi:predicted nucleotidyltransferase
MVSPVRNSYLSMMKQGKFRAFRNLPVGWLLQVLHSTDRTERWLRVGTEVLLIAALWYFLECVGYFSECYLQLFWAFLIVHSLSWFFIGNFWVYMLDSFLWVRNPGLEGVLSFVNFARRLFVNSDACDAVLIYGSMCRGAFHGRSDLDLRIIRKPGLLLGMKAIIVGYVVRVLAAIRKIPVDLQVVDSLEFLIKQMRADERPITVYLSPGFKIVNAGWDYEEVLADHVLVLRDKPSHAPSPS